MNIIQQFACLSALSFSLATIAQEDAQENAPEPPPLYQVEVLVFKHLDQSRTSEEIPRLAEPQIEDVLDEQLAQMGELTGNELEIPSDISDEISDEISGEGSDEAEPALFWSAAPEGELNMDGDAARLQKLQAYDVLAHLAWVQPAHDVTIAEEIEVAELGAWAGINGTLKLYRKKYLHLAVNLDLGDANREQSAGERTAQLLPVNQTHPSIADSRRMRLGRTVYFDQPKFGVLATVYKIDTLADETAVSAIPN